MAATILVFGNKDLEEDSFALEIADDLKDTDIRLVKCEVPDTVLDYLDSNDVFIMDVVRGINKVILIKDIDELLTQKPLTLHDFDLGSFLRLLHACGKAGNIRIIGIPQKGNKEIIKKQIKDLIDM